MLLPVSISRTSPLKFLKTSPYQSFSAIHECRTGTGTRDWTDIFVVLVLSY